MLASDLPAIAGITNVAMTFPLPDSFQTPLVRITLDGENYYLNDTDQYAQLGSTGCDGTLGIALSTRAWEVIHAAKRLRGRDPDDLHTPAGRQRPDADRGFAVVLRRGLQRQEHGISPNCRPRNGDGIFRKPFPGVAQGARPVGDLTTAFDTYPGLEQFSVIIDNYGVTDGNYFYFNLPFTPSLMPAGAEQRALPLMISHGGKNTIRTEIELPPEFRRVVVAPKSEDLTVAVWRAGAHHCQANLRRIRCHRRVRNHAGHHQS